MKRAKPEPQPTRYEGETFQNIGGYEFNNLTAHWKEPNCFNGIVSVRRWRVVLEQIEEPDEVIAARIKKLWRECDNHHQWAPLKAAAAKVGLTLSHDDMGVDKPAQRGR